MDTHVQEFCELGIAVTNVTSTKPGLKAKKCNPKLKTFREFTMATLSALVEWKLGPLCESTVLTVKQGSSSQILALDALACTGIAGIQWKKHLSASVNVTMADHDDINTLTENAKTNSLSCQSLVLDPTRVPGDPVEKQGDTDIHACQAEAKTVMTMEAFNFIYLNPHKNCTSYFEPAFHSISCGGLLCFVLPDVSMFARSPHVVKRYFDADVVKTEYLKEMAARIVLASLARAAAKYNKGISPQYVLSHEDNLLICVKACRGHKVADTALNEIGRLLHCRFCEERSFLPQQLAPLEEPYKFLRCKCKEENPGKTALVLGPMWKGPMNDPAILMCLSKHGKQLSLSSQFFDKLRLLMVESLCAKSDREAATVCGHESGITHNGTRDDCASHHVTEGRETTAVCESLNADKPSETFVPSSKGDARTEDTTISSTSDTQGSAQTLLNKVSRIDDCITVDENASTDTNKRKGSTLTGEHSAAKYSKQQAETVKPVNVPFYHNVNKFKKTNIPKLDKLVTILHSAGYQASRTHFDPCAIRTSASVEELLNILGGQR